MRIWAFAFPIIVEPHAFYTFLADREECDGQCTYCLHAHNHAKWEEIRIVITRFLTDEKSWHNPIMTALVQRLMDSSWDNKTWHECMPGIITLRLLAYCYGDPNELLDPRVIQFLENFNANTGALDLIQSSWAGLLAGGWPVFHQFAKIRGKILAVLEDDEITDFPELPRKNACDMLDSAAHIAYRDTVMKHLETGNLAPSHLHMDALVLNRPGCELGAVTALLGPRGRSESRLVSGKPRRFQELCASSGGHGAGRCSEMGK
jgi:hypothetical protein